MQKGVLLPVKIERLNTEEHKKTRPLYEEVFSEDTAEFVDYYYQNKAAENEIFAAEEKDVICGMAHINPYQLCADGREERGAYLVAVATKKEFRHRKVMTSLLRRIFRFLYREKCAFLYLMPAAEAIYTPFDFRFFYFQRQRVLHRTGTLTGTGLKVREAKESDFAVLCDTLNKILEKRYRLFARRTPAYLADLSRELKAMKGKMMAVFDGMECIGAFQIILEDEPMIFEPVFQEGYEGQTEEAMAEAIERELGTECRQIKIAALSEKTRSEEEKEKPWMMGRIIHLEQWASALKSKNKKKVAVEIKDGWIAENEGRYEITILPDGGKIKKTEKKENLVSLSIAELPEFFKEESPYAQAFLNEWV